MILPQLPAERLVEEQLLQRLKRGALAGIEAEGSWQEPRVVLNRFQALILGHCLTDRNPLARMSMK